jgi:hypothetical protein
MTAPVRQTIRLFEIDKPRCSRTYGVAPCAAVLGTTGDRKCFNSRKTCQDLANLDLSETVTLRFSESQEGAEQYGPVIPSIISVSTVPLTINLGGMEDSGSPLGNRETVTIKVKDQPYSDLLTDKYRLERETGAAQADGIGYKPFDRGTFWPKFLARDPYYAGYTCRLREGYVGDAVADMRVREYALDSIEGPTEGTATIRAKDLFSLIEKRKAQAPTASTGELAADLTGTPATFTLAPAGIGDLEYGPLEDLMGTPGAGHVAIGGECIQYTRVGDVMTPVLRGALGTTQDDHKQDDVVQWVLSFTRQAPHDIIYTLLTSFSEVPAANIPKTDWDARMLANDDFYSANIAKPTPVDDLVGELVQQAALSVWPDVTTGMVELRPLRARSSVATLDDDGWFLDDVPLQPVRAEEKRLSEVRVYYGQVNPLDDQKDSKNYHSRLIERVSGGYATDAVREVYSRWIPQGGRTFASHTAQRIAAMFSDTPIETTFGVSAVKAIDITYADYVDVEAFEIQDDTGAIATVTQAVTEITRDEEEVKMKGQSVAFPAGDDGVRRIYLENTGLRNINLRTEHDKIFPAPTAGVQVEFIIAEGIIVGSTSAAAVALRSGTWPDGIVPTLKGEGPGMGRIQGKGGNGPDGGSYLNGFSGAAGQNGGDALQADSPITVDRTYLEIWGGGGAGGAGGGMRNNMTFWGGGAGAPGAGEDPGAGGAAGAELNVYDPGLESTGSTTATTEAAGSPGLGGRYSGGGPVVRQQGGNGGAGGGPGQDGSAGQAAQNGTGDGTVIGTGGAGGTKGKYIVNNANVTWTGGPGDLRGAVG